MADKLPEEPSVVVHVTIVNPLRKVKRHATGSAFARAATPALVMEAAREALKEATERYTIKRGNYSVKDHLI